MLRSFKWLGKIVSRGSGCFYEVYDLVHIVLFRLSHIQKSILYLSSRLRFPKTK